LNDQKHISGLSICSIYYNLTPNFMRRLLLTAVMTLLTAVAFSQTNNLLWTMTVDVKMDKRLEWEKKLVTFAKTHYPQLKYRVWEVMSGRNTGRYIVTVGPTSYKEMGTPNVSPKGEALQKTDSQALDALCNYSEVNYYTIVEGLSPANPNRKPSYMVASYTELNIGTWGDASTFLTRQQEARVKGGSTRDISVLRPSNSGPGNSYVSIRFVEKMEELDASENLPEMYDKAFGNNSWYKDWTNYAGIVKSNRSEIRALRSDLSNL